MIDKTIAYYPSMPLDDVHHYWAHGLLSVSAADEEQLLIRLQAAIRDERESRNRADRRFDELESELNTIQSEMQELEFMVNDRNDRIAEYEEMAATIVPSDPDSSKDAVTQDSNQPELGL